MVEGTLTDPETNKQGMQVMGRPPDKTGMGLVDHDAMEMETSGDPTGGEEHPLYRSFAHVDPDTETTHHSIARTSQSGETADRTIRKIGYQNAHRVEATGFSGGIWLLWNDFWKVDIISTTTQFIHCRVWDQNETNFLFTAVYAHPTPSRREELWHRLAELQIDSTLPWVLLGDFNSIVQSSERMGGSTNRTGVNHQFVRWIINSRLMDLGFLGPRFTWKRGNLYERLDRGLCNTDWRLAYPEASVSHLIRYQSDHRPLLLDLCSFSPIRAPRPFRFLRAWMSHEKYDDFVMDNWDRNQDLMDNIQSFTEKLQVWNREVFGNIFWQKKHLWARIAGIQRVLEHRCIPHFVELEAELKQELDKILLREESLWHQKSRSEWLHLGDRNTSFFHLRTIRRRKRNRIKKLQNELGEWIDDQNLLKAMAVSFYERLYDEDELHRPLYVHRGLFPPLSNLQMEEVQKPFRFEALEGPGS
ncbi:uncharacterized protein LOC125189963 [Salvia hispanica]|uniref:uncharacterized protein LOC125189963 n=1 Tax=Salvia hispanica TaxID=49212 RepID=UPI00200922BB|nr:uncharacterized protein LOC125189963 [Salvia hispanica]